jgi:hypothetical protein
VRYGVPVYYTTTRQAVAFKTIEWFRMVRVSEYLFMLNISCHFHERTSYSWKGDLVDNSISTSKHVLEVLIVVTTTRFCQTFLQVSRAYSLQHLNIGGTFITDESLYAVANNCTNLKVRSPFLNLYYFIRL